MRTPISLRLEHALWKGMRDVRFLFLPQATEEPPQDEIRMQFHRSRDRL